MSYQEIYKEILCEKRNQTLWIYLNRPKDMNSITSGMLLEIQEVLSKARLDDDIRVLVMSGKGPAFCAGADLKVVFETISQEPSAEPDFFEIVEQAFGMLADFPKPFIAALNGLTLAGGLELAMAADLILAADSAKIGDAHSNFGVLPGAGGSVHLPRRIGLNRAKYLLFTGEFISSAEMKEFGLVSQVVPDAELEVVVQKLADKLSAKSPLVLRRMKKLVVQGLDQPVKIAIHSELLALRQHIRSYDLSEGLTAFVEKRKPEFKGY